MSLYIFDKDKTLLKPRYKYGIIRSAPSSPEQQVLRPGVWDKLATLRGNGHAIALASNQTMVAQGIITFEQAVSLMEDCADKVGGVDAWLFSPFSPTARWMFWKPNNIYCRDDESRKPHPGMIFELMKMLHFSPEDSIMVGDANADFKAAKSAGIKFMSAKNFFQ